NRNSVLEARISQLVDRNAELQRKLHESQIAYQHLEQHVNAQKEAEESKKDDEEETAMAKKNGGKRKAEYQYNTLSFLIPQLCIRFQMAARKASKIVAAMTSTQGESRNFEDEKNSFLNFPLQITCSNKKELAKLVPLPTGDTTLEPYQIKEGSKTHSTSEDFYKMLTVQKLRALLKERGLMVKGNKVTIKNLYELDSKTKNKRQI
ncbi:hypothetical protein MKX03_000463, partial [Papaver bracteatum]